MQKKKQYLKSDATIVGNYRYSLSRIWDDSLDKITFIMLNPSTADATADDKTILSCIRQAKSWGYGGFEVVNLFSYRSTDMTVLNNSVANVIGDENDKYIKLSIAEADKVILAWGNALSEKKVKVHPERASEVIKLLGNIPLYCIELTGIGCPKHPLYCKTTNRAVEIIWNGEKFVEKKKTVIKLKPTIKRKVVIDDSAVHDDIWDIEDELREEINKKYRTRCE